MNYVMSDIHGCYNEYCQMLNKINFNDTDVMYILGDVFDRGGGSIRVLQDMKKRKNIFPIIGNHDYTAYNCIKELKAKAKEEKIHKKVLDSMPTIQYWVRHGGSSSIEELKMYSLKEIDEIIEYISTFSLLKEIKIKDKKFILVHAGLENFNIQKPLSEYTIDEVCMKVFDYSKRYFSDNTYIVTGHMPTFQIDKAFSGKIYHNQNNIVIDCGIAYGQALGCLCLDTMREYYVHS